MVKVSARGMTDDAYRHLCDRHGIGDIRRHSKLNMLPLVLVEVSMKQGGLGIKLNLVFARFLVGGRLLLFSINSSLNNWCTSYKSDVGPQLSIMFSLTPTTASLETKDIVVNLYFSFAFFAFYAITRSDEEVCFTQG